jgi:hypothetical protein
MNEIQIYVIKEGRKTGPFTKEEIQAMLASSAAGLNDIAWTEGNEEWKPLHVILGVPAPVEAVKIEIPTPASTPKPKPAYLYISTPRLIFMTVISLGVFTSYWTYKNWRYIKERDGMDISPFWRGWFTIFHLHALLKYIKEDPKISHAEKPDYSSGWLTFGFVLFTVCGNQIVIPSMLTFLFVLPAHNYISRVNRSAENPPEFSPWSFGQILCALFIPILLFAVVFFSAMASRRY